METYWVIRKTMRSGKHWLQNISRQLRHLKFIAGWKSKMWGDFWKHLEEVALQKRTEYTDMEFCDALEHYRNQSIHDSSYWELKGK